MSRTATYHTTVRWTGEHWGHLTMGNGPEMTFSAPPDAQGHAGVFTPEDAFVAAANTCVMLMFIWAAERFKLKLHFVRVPHRGHEADRAGSDGDLQPAALPAGHPRRRERGGVRPRGGRTRRAHWKRRRKYSLVANSVKSEIVVEPQIIITSEQTTAQ